MGAENIYNNGTYQSENPDWHLGHSSTKVKWIKDIIPGSLRHSISSVLEIGCGRGATLNELKTYLGGDRHFTGIDVSTEAITYARNNFKGIEFLCTDIFSLRNNNAYDLVLCIDVLEHVYCQDEFIRCAASISKFGIFHVPLGNNLRNRLLDRWKQQIFKFGHVQFYNVGSLINFFTNAGFAIRDYRYTFGLEYPEFKYIYPFVSWIFRLSPYIVSQSVGLVSLLVLLESINDCKDYPLRER